MTVKDWLTSPVEWGDWGGRANAWFNEVVDSVRDLLARVTVLEGAPGGGGDDIGFRAYNLSTVTAPNATPITLMSGGITVTTLGGGGISVNNSTGVFTVTEAGLYTISASTDWTTTFGNYAICKIEAGTSTPASYHNTVYNGGATGHMGINYTIHLAASATFYVTVYQGSTGTRYIKEQTVSVVKVLTL